MKRKRNKIVECPICKGKNNLSEIHVGTQLNNIKAQNFYIKCGFKHINNNSVYHWWIKGEE